MEDFFQPRFFLLLQNPLEMELPDVMDVDGVPADVDVDGVPADVDGAARELKNV